MNNRRNEFYSYIGEENDLSGYQRSYKLVFYKAFFEGTEGNSMPVGDLTVRFRQFYIARMNAGLTTDKQPDRVIEDPIHSSNEAFLGLILKNPFNAISNHGYFIRITVDGVDSFALEKQLAEELTNEDRRDILDLVERKLKLYYAKLDSTQVEDGKMREVLDRFLNEYIAEKAKPLTGNPFAAFVRNDIPQAIYDTGIVTLKDYVVTGGVGQGNWAMVPWIGIFDRKITVRATKGVYAVYLLAKDGKTLYLTFNQGCTDIRKNHSKRETIRIMRQKAGEIASSLDARGFDSDEDINLGEGLTELAELYQKGTIFYKKYEQGKVPSESELQDDLKKMMDIYKDYVVKFENTPEPQGEDKPGPEGTNEVISIKDSIESIKSYISAAGFTYPDGVIENFYLSLKSKPFVILAGTSGTGKTKLVRLFAEAVGATSESGGGNGRFKLVSVRPDWSDSSDLFGHENLKGEFVPGAIIDFVKRASEDLKHPYFLCFDEMNLARVEYYLSDFLSIIETRKRVGSELVTDEVLLPRSASSKYGKIILPENLYVIGTVNMDETTFPFSKKVLDRANTIEFSYVNLEPSFDINAEQGEILNLGNEFLKAEYLVLKKDIPYELQNYAADICVKLQEINDILQKAQAHVGYRVRDEIVFYMLNNKSAELLDEEVALDNEIMQKILPRIQGSSASIRNLLCDLFKEFAGDYTGLNQASVSDQMQEYMKAKSCRYPKSAAKICYMMRRFEEDGFTSYWL